MWGGEEDFILANNLPPVFCIYCNYLEIFSHFRSDQPTKFQDSLQAFSLLAHYYPNVLMLQISSFLKPNLTHTYTTCDKHKCIF